MLRATGTAALLALPAVPSAAQGTTFTGCDGPDTISSLDLQGDWRIDEGHAVVSGVPSSAGGQGVRLQATAGDLTLEIDGRRIGLQQTDAPREELLWPTGPRAPVSAEQLEIVLGCRIDDLPRWAERGSVTAEGRTAAVYWRVFAIEPDWVILQYDLAGPPSAAGFFSLGR
ncbi:hypothetical protein [Histidinibacterium lentulum]|uniref:Uncharacterized protein n=1 Tax=Histidinibacterium lentulum TaxID=2480588 RepID=A0A3N2QRB2_9RHOB|nr:hypothetical protein [Histidinibacterium lentulum]ROT97721.1 hypothetical protein EAT49_18105 [Histidinibacterium lentulum]